MSNGEHEKFVHSIGNLCLLSPTLNSEASNKGFEKKKETYKNANLMLLQDIIFDDDNKTERNDWNQDSINQRKNQLIKFAKEQWQDLKL